MTPAALDRLAQLDTLTIHEGSHSTFEQGHCAIELVAWLANEPFSDAPVCVCPVLRAFVLAWNDALPSDEDRARLLRPFIPRLIDTKTTHAIEQRRMALALDWLARVQTPAWLDLTPSLAPHAAALRALPMITNTATAKAAQQTLNAARAAAGAAVRATVGAAAWDAAWDAARDAAWAAAWDAAWAAAGDAAWAAAGAAAWDAAGAAATRRLAPTMALLQASAVDLLDRMIRAGEPS